MLKKKQMFWQKMWPSTQLFWKASPDNHAGNM